MTEVSPSHGPRAGGTALAVLALGEIVFTAPGELFAVASLAIAACQPGAVAWVGCTGTPGHITPDGRGARRVRHDLGPGSRVLMRPRIPEHVVPVSGP